MRKLQAKFLRRKQHRTGDNSPEIHHQQETSHGPPGPPSRHDTDLRPPSENTPVPSFPDGVEVLHDCHDATIDICFVHGLTGNRDSTWTAKGQSKPWPKVFLPLKLTSTRILTYGYDAYIILEIDDKYIQSVQDRFWSMVCEQQKAGQDLKVICFFEELPLSGIRKVVSRDSATLKSYNAISIHANHSNMESQIRNSTVRQSRRPKEEAPITKSANSSFNNFGPGDQLNAPGGNQNISKGSGNHFPGATFSGPVQFGKEGSQEDVSEDI
ncbi:hypothetical protein NW765_001376 [Fusarium oxysporum]|nr:hypothetical protein NW765_001376 [Fusarium oxysporum]